MSVAAAHMLKWQGTRQAKRSQTFPVPNLSLFLSSSITVFPQEEKKERELINYSDWRLSGEDLRRWWIVR